MRVLNSMFNIKKEISIRTFFQLFLVISVIFPLLVLGAIGLFISSDILNRELTLSNTRQIGLVADRFEQYLENPYENLKILSELLTLRHSEGDGHQAAVIKAFTEQFDNVESIHVADLTGNVTMMYPVDTYFLNTDISGHAYFHEAIRSQQPFWAPSYMSEQFDAPVITLSLPYRDGVITAVLSLGKISSILNSSPSIDSDLILYATDQNGVYISHPDTQKVLLQEYDPFFISHKSMDHIAGEISEYNDVLYLTYFEIIDNSNWMVVLMQPLNKRNEPVKAMAYSLMILTVIIILIALFAGNILRRYFSIPLNDLIYSTRGISEGYYDIKVPVVNFHELSQLAKSISKMSGEIGKREEALIKSRTYLDNIIDSMPSIIIGVNADLNISLWNRQAEIVTGIKYDNAIGNNLEMTVPRLSSEIPKILKSISEKEKQEDLQRVHIEKGIKVIENITIYPLIANGDSDVNGVVLRIDDVTEKALMEEILIQNEKMLSVGGLAAGMAHEINNPLAGMIQTAHVLSNRLGLNKKIKANVEAAEEVNISLESMKQYLEVRDVPHMLNSINQSGKRISAIVKNMLSFVRNSDDNVSSHNINKIIEHSLELAATDYNLKKNYDFRKIQITKEYSDDLPLVFCEETKIQQVLFNILQNGAHAMSEKSIENPTFIIRTYVERLGEKIVIEIEDNGPGIDEDVQKRIFEPFFTTKPVGIGTGLGLSVSYFIITESQKGEMTVESCLGEGAKFIIKLPLS